MQLLNELRTLIESEIADFCAGLQSPGEPESAEEIQQQLMARIASVFDGEHIAAAGKMIIPVGWKLVPVEPTDAMAVAAINVILSGDESINGVASYRAMVNAAPEAPHD